MKIWKRVWAMNGTAVVSFAAVFWTKNGCERDQGNGDYGMQNGKFCGMQQIKANYTQLGVRLTTSKQEWNFRTANKIRVQLTTSKLDNSLIVMQTSIPVCFCLVSILLQQRSSFSFPNPHSLFHPIFLNFLQYKIYIPD